MNNSVSLIKPKYVQKNNLIIFPKKRSNKQESIIQNQSFNVGSIKSFSRNYYTGNFLTLNRAMQETKEWAYVCSGLSHYKRSLIIIDCDISQSISEFYTKIINDMGIEPNYIRHHKTNGHNQAGFFHSEISIFNNAKHRQYLDIVDGLNKHFHERGWGGWKIQNPYYESDEYITQFYHKDQFDYNDLVRLIKKFPEYKKEVIIPKKKEVKVSRCGYNHKGSFVNGRYAADLTWCGTSRHKWILAKTNEEIINYLNAHKCMPTVDYVVDKIYSRWPSSYDKIKSYTIEECRRDIENQIRTFRPSRTFSKDSYTRSQRLISMQKRHLQKLVKIYNMFCLIENKNIKPESARKQANVSTNAYKEYRKSSIDQVMNEILESVSGLKDWGKLRDKSFESLVKNIKGLSHSSPLYEKMENEYNAEKEVFEKQISECDCYMEKIYSSKDMLKKRRYIACINYIRKGLNQNKRLKKLRLSS